MADDSLSRPRPMDPLRDIGDAVSFLTRLRLPGTGSRDGIAGSAWAFPLAGLLIGAGGAVVLVGCVLIGIPAPVAAALAVAAIAVVTGALHEDGLADTFDGFGGSTRSRRLEIMQDSGIGAFGVTALVLTLAIRIAALAALTAHSAVAGAGALIAAESLSRAIMVAIWRGTPAAKTSGLSVASGAPSLGAVLTAAATGAAALMVAAIIALGLAGSVLGAVFAVTAAYVFSRIILRALGGRTGDTLGACQQIALVAFLVGVSVV